MMMTYSLSLPLSLFLYSIYLDGSDDIAILLIDMPAGFRWGTRTYLGLGRLRHRLFFFSFFVISATAGTINKITIIPMLS